MERGVDVSSEKLDRLNEGVRMAEEKGLREPLILLGTTAFVVNVKNNKVVDLDSSMFGMTATYDYQKGLESLYSIFYSN